MKAQDIIDQLGPLEGAIDPFKIAEKFNVQISEGPNLPNISIEALMKGRVVWIDPGLSDQMRNYMLASKLATILGEREDTESFVCALLLPEAMFRRAIRGVLIRQMGSMLEVRYLAPMLAEIFNVPEFLIVKRLETLKLLLEDGGEVIYETQLN